MEELAKNQTHIAQITGYSSTGAGVARIAGRAVFVERAIIGEAWEVLILKVTASAVYGKGLRLISPSPERAGPDCPVFGACGGCDLRHMKYREELNFKLGRVNDALERISGLDIKSEKIIPSREESLNRYRNKAIFSFAYDTNGHVRFGFYRKGSHSLTAIDDCLIQSEAAVSAARALRNFVEEKQIPLYDEKTRSGSLRHLMVRGAKNGGCVAVIISATGFHEHTAELVYCLRPAVPELTGIVLCVNKSPGNVVLGGQYHTLWGNDHISDTLCGLTFRVSPESFFQINPPQAEALYAKALEYVGGADTVLDLYCGTGTITLCLAQRVRLVYGAEIVEAAVENARENARENAVENARFIVGDAANAAEYLKSRGIRAEAIVVDPPRKGLTPELINTIAEMSPERVVYVSCDPGTLARDLKLLAEKGYNPQSVTAVDMFPRTHHVETVTIAERSSAYAIDN